MTKKRIPASIRNKNPGAMYPGDASRKFGSTTYEVLKSKDGEHRCATFATHEQGAAAMFWLLAQPRYANGQRTLEQIIGKWCGGFRTGSYLKLLETKTGVSASTVITVKMLNDPEIAVPIARAMAVQEAGVDYPLGEAGWQVAHDMAFDGVLGDVPVAAVEKAAPTVTASRKWSVANYLKGMFGGTAVGGVSFASADSIQATKSYLDVVKGFATDYGVPILIGLAVAGYVLSQLLQNFMKQDVAEGRYVPSGEAE